ncbi:hypothetical protein N7540_012984 [Penicillium herquei]|nr:hypothetical protein N7540_012984 [Penicillium herquei]
MDSTSFRGENSGTQVGINHGRIIQNYFSSGRLETPEQNTDNEILESLAFPQMLDRRDNIEPCHTNTCKWVLELEEYQSWRSQSHGLLWVKGKPGSGKSTLMVFLHDKLQRSQDESPGIRLDFFFTARGTEMQRTPLGMLRSLLNQIFDRDPTVRPQIREKYDRRCKQFGYGKRQWEWPQVILEELLTSAILQSAIRQHLVVFVDALDEAGSQSAQQLAGYFHRLVDRAEKMKLSVQVCISCRHYPIMESGRAIEIKVEDHNQQDIATYIQDTLIQRDTKDNTSQEIREMLVKQLTQQANGIFQWVHIMIPLIEPRIRERESFDDISCWLREVPAGLEDTYSYILNNVIGKRNREQSFLFFQWVCLAERPLTVAEMRYALVAKNARETLSLKRWERIYGFIEKNEDVPERVKALSGGLAEVVSSGDKNETIQVVHQSVNEFLRIKGLEMLCQNTGISTSSITMDRILSQCQTTLYRSCLVYLIGFHKAGKTSGLKGTREKLVQDYALLEYATTNLFIHAEKAADSRPEIVKNEKEILQKVLGRWVQVYQKLKLHSNLCPPRGTTLLHMAAAANLADLIEPVAPEDKDIAIRNGNGDTALHLAARWGHVIAGKLLRRKGADQVAKNHSGKTPLGEAASGGHLEFVEWLLDEGVDLGRNGDGATLQAASLGGYAGVVEILVGAGADVNAQGGYYGNALQAAASNGSAETVQILLEAGTDVNAQGGYFGNALQAAAWSGSAEIVQILLEAGADVNAQGGQYGNALQAAAYRGSTETVQIFLEAGADVNAQGGEYGNALQAAASNGSAETVQILLEAGADINAQGGEYGNALQAAAYRGSAEKVQILLEAGADVNAQGGHFGNALQAAAYRGSTETVQILLEAGTDINAQGGYYGNALQAAAYRGSTETVQILLEAGTDINAQGGYYGNALQAAAYRGSTETVQILLEAGADVNAQGGYYGNALQAAASNGSAETVQILLEAGADVNAQGGYFGNALQAAAWSRSAEIVQILLEAGADVNAQGGEYGNALQVAASNESAETVQILLEAGTDINAQGGYFGNALQAAAYRGSTETVQILLEAGADVNAQGGYYGNALQAAASNGSAETVQILLEAGADVNAQGGHFGNALQAAAWSRSAEIVQILLEAGADVNAQGGEYGNALQVAASNESAETVQILLEAGTDINAQGGYYGNALQAAAWSRSAEIVQILLEAGADINAQGGYFGNALQAAAYRGSTETVQILLEAGTDINAQGGYFGNALQAAACDGSAETVQIFLEAGADVNAQGGEYGNALQAAAWSGSAETVQIFLEAGADVNAQRGRYGSPILAAIHKGYVDQVQILLHAGADSLLADELGRTPLHIAASNNMLHLLRRFPQLASDLNKRSDLLQTPLHLAVCLGHIEFAIWLLNYGADPSLLDGYGKHVMDWASDHEALLQEINNHCPQLVLTHRDIQELSVHRSLFELSESLLHSKSKSSWAILQQLGRYFMVLGQFDNARYLFQLHLPRDACSKTDILQISCNTCNQIITGTRFICRVCACMDLCSSCVQKYPCHSRLHPNQEHEVFAVSNVPDENSKFTGPASERLARFLRNLKQCPNQSEIEPSNDSLLSLALTEAALRSKVPFSPATRIFPIFLGVSAIVLGAWYF